MQRRTIAFLLMLAAAGGGPYLAHTETFSVLVQRVQRAVAALRSGAVPLATDPPVDPANDAEEEARAEAEGSDTPTGNEEQPQPDGYADDGIIQNMAAVFDFNITPEWVINRWPYVTTALGELDLQGMRAALVTGTRTDDLVGAITYYFDRQHKLQRISFYGYTGDAGRLIELLTRYHGFRPVRTLDAGLFLKRWNGRPTSVLWLGHAPLVRADAPTERVIVRLEINRTDGPYRLSQEMADFLQDRRNAGRW